MNAVLLPRTSTAAVVSLIFGVLTWFALPFLGAIIAVICGHAARSEIRHSAGQLEGGGLAMTGLLLGWFHLALWALGFALLIVLPLGILGGMDVFGHWVHSLHDYGCNTINT